MQAADDKELGFVMRKTALMCCAAALLPAAPAAADTLQQALEAAYRGNPTMTAARANVRAADENVPIARAAGLPTIEAGATFEENVLKGRQAATALFSDPERQLVGQVNATMPLITFGAVSGAVKAAEARVSASRLGLRQTESELFTAVVGAYLDVLRDEATVKLNQRNRDVIDYTLKETRDRQRAGDRGPTDVAQAEARLALAVAQLETAESRLIGSRETYVQLVGNAPGQLDQPPPLPTLPATPEDAVATALDRSPRLAASKSERVAAEHDVRAARAEGLPRVNAIAGVNHYDYLGSLDPGTGPRNRDDGTTAQVGVQLKVPLFQGGRVAAQTRQAQEKLGAAIEQTIAAEREVIAETRSAHATWRAAQRVVAAAERGVGANERALEGVRAQTRAGLRPLLDQLNAEQELLNAQVTLVTARRDSYVAGFALLAATGMAEARNLNLDGGILYDPELHFRKVRHQIMGTGKTPQQVGTSTSATQAQDAAIPPS